MITHDHTAAIRYFTQDPGMNAISSFVRRDLPVDCRVMVLYVCDMERRLEGELVLAAGVYMKWKIQ